MSVKYREKVVVQQFPAFYGLAFIGVSVYYVQLSTGFWMGVLGVLKAMVWPALLAHKLFETLAM